MARGREEGKAVLVRVPKEMYEQIEELVKKGYYRAPADFFYVAGQKELERAMDRLRQWERMQQEGDCEILSDAEVV
jgi:Arc/MetJ-type ribon-helix-helix transcriptional regulator